MGETNKSQAIVYQAKDGAIERIHIPGLEKGALDIVKDWEKKYL